MAKYHSSQDNTFHDYKFLKCYTEKQWELLTLTTAVLTGFDKVAEEVDAKRRQWKKKQGKMN